MQRPILPARWRKFRREVGSVVLGVLIALAIGKAADAIRWKFRVAGNLAAIRAELSGNRYNYAECRAYQPCMDRRIAALGKVLDAARRTGVLPRIGNVGEPGARMNESFAYEIARSEGAPLRMNRDLSRDLARFYGGADMYVTVTEAERNEWSTLSLLEASAGPVSDDLMSSLLQAWSRAKTHANFIGLVARQGDTSLAAFGVPIEDQAITDDYTSLIHDARMKPVCRPLIVDGRSMP